MNIVEAEKRIKYMDRSVTFVVGTLKDQHHLDSHLISGSYFQCRNVLA